MSIQPPDTRIRRTGELTWGWLSVGAARMRRDGLSQDEINKNIADLFHPDAIAQGFNDTVFWNNNPADRPWIRYVFKIPEAVLTEAAVVAGVAAPSRPRPQSSIMERIIALLRRLRYYFPI